MVIGVNTRFLLKNKLEGFGWYTYETISRITRSHPEHQFIFFFDREFDSKYIFSDNIIPVVIGPQARRPVLQRIWFDYSIPKQLKKYKCDIFVSPDGYLSLKTKVPQLVVMHDLSFEHNPKDIPKYDLVYLRKRYPKFAEIAQRICTVSEYSKNDIVKTYGVSPDKIDITYNGVSPVFKVIEETKKTEIRKKCTNGNPFILFVGAIHKRKNLQRLIQAFEQLKLAGEIEHHLLIVGEPMWNSHKVKIDEKVKSSIHFTGHISLEVLASITASATCLAFVSYFEGFGIPILEAMQSGTPVLAGNRTSLPEVGGEAALYCDPFSVDSIREQLKMLVTDENLQKSLTEKGLERVKNFSWDFTARDLWNSIEKVMNDQ